MPKDTTVFPEDEGTQAATLQAAVRESGDAAASVSTRARVSVGDTFTGTITSGDQDFIAVQLEAGQTYVFTAYGSGGAGGLADPVLAVRDSSGGLLLENDDAMTGNRNSAVTFTPSVSGTYYLDVGGYGGSTGQYTVRTATDVFTIEQVASQLTDMGWGIANSPIRMTGAVNGTVTYNIDGLTAEGQALAEMALGMWESYTGIDFVRTNSPSANIVFDDFSPTATGNLYAFAGPTNYNPVGGAFVNAVVTISSGWLASFGTQFGSYSYLTYLHEIGHALGLGHGGFYDGNAQYGIDNLYLNDSYQLTIMSYFDADRNTFVNASSFYPITPMAGDIAAMQYLYGASRPVFAGNTVWGSGTNITGHLGTAMQVMFDYAALPSWMAPGITFGFTIVDSGGIDTMNFSNTTQTQVIDMRAGGVSNVYGEVGTVVVALGTVIENAIGGYGADTIYGNSTANFIQGFGGDDVILADLGNDLIYANAGNDSVDGGDGSDEMWGGGGRDTLVGGNGNDLMGGGIDNDQLFGGSGRDSVWGGVGNDSLSGGSDADELSGAPGRDTILGGGGADTIFAAPDNDIVYGEDGDDILWAGTGDDFVYGGAGNDTIMAGGGRDALFGGSGADTFVFFRNDGVNRIEDFSADEGDRVQLARWLWQSQFGDLTPQQIEERFASIGADGNVVLTFGAANTTIVIDGLTDVTAVDQYLTIV